LTVNRNTETKRMALGMILLTDMREIDIAYLICGIEIYKQTAIADGNVTHILAVYHLAGLFGQIAFALER